MKPIDNTALEAILLQRARGPRGVGSTEIAGVDQQPCWIALDRLAKDGRLHKVKISHKLVRFFDTAERAKEFADRCTRVVTPKRAHHAMFGPDDPVQHYALGFTHTIAPTPIPTAPRTNTYEKF